SSSPQSSPISPRCGCGCSPRSFLLRLFFSFWRLFMAASWMHRLLKKLARPGSRSRRHQHTQGRALPALESLADRILPAVTAVFLPRVGLLTVLGDAGNNNITLSRDAAGNILINGGTVPILGGTPTFTNTTTISVFGLSGNDTITLDEANGALPKALLFGGDGNDTLTGGSGADQLLGQSGHDHLPGQGGTALLLR